MDPDPSSYFFLADIIKPFDPALIAPLLILLVLLICSAIVSGSEVAFFSLKSQDLEELRQSNKNVYDSITDLLDHPKTLLATILISNNFVNVGIVILSSYLTAQMFDFSQNEMLGLVVQLVVITFLILLFGEVLPKVYATRKAVSFSSFMSRPMFIMRWVFRPFSLMLVRSTSFIERRLQTSSENLSVDDLSQALELANEDTTDDEQKILEGIVKFGSITVKQIMKPRMDVVAVDQAWDYERVMGVILDSGYSRIPVYEENFDQVRGVLYIKDLIPHIEEATEFNWLSLIREPFYIPENKKIDDLLKEFQDKKVHLAIVVDEFGGTCGIITLEDVIEEIVGEISDEFDDDELVYSKLDERNYVFEGKIHLNDFFRVMHIDGEAFAEKRGEADTLAGFLLELAGKFPEKNEETEFDRFIFKVESLEGRRIKRIKVTLTNEDQKEGEEN
ncbi:MAG TPA: hemolysin [Cryomorphaceae bacterium]|nr:hemolysin [Owenweeksia sp.]MBF97460.1 hemolysin [Owenweeksia sp.]HAD96022.1 hemolysin [Cryomorphaceae bacterium]HBF20407.1 hemolysin [Cryomorphaceae bacterium]HCQ16371.1 hemolysin [Cryomorphaceae bacterium]